MEGRNRSKKSTEKYLKLTRNQCKIHSNSIKNRPKNRPKIDQKSTKNRPKMDQKSVSGGPWGLLGAKIEKRQKKMRTFGASWPSWARLGGLLGPSWRLDRRLGPSWGVLNRKKIDAKIDRKNDASWNRFLDGFWWILGGKMEACWHQNRSKIDANLEERFFEKTLFFLRKNHDFEGSGGRSWK